MIKDTDAQEEFRKDWNGVKALKMRFVRDGFAASGVGLFPFALVNAAHNLVFIHACAVLNDVLEQLKDEGHFECGQRTLGALVRASKNTLPWKDYELIKAKVVPARNAIAHDGTLLDRENCWKYTEAVENELFGWCGL